MIKVNAGKNIKVGKADFSRRQFLMLMAGLSCLPLLSACMIEDQPVSIAAHVWAGYEPMFLARSEGWLDSKQVKLFETGSATESLQALADGKVDGAALTLDEVLRARANGLPLSVVMVFDVSAGADVMVTRPGIKTLGDLKGKRIAYEQGAVGELMLSAILQAAGLPREAVKGISLPSDKHDEAWDHGTADAFITYEPVARRLISKGAVNLFDSRQIPDTIVDVLAVRSDVLDRSHAAAIRNLISAHFKALGHMRHNPQDASYRMATRMGLPADQVMGAFQGMVLPDAINNRRMLAGPTPQMAGSARSLSDLMLKAGFLQQEAPLTGLFSADYLPAPD
ncbi:MAG: ABC transporter substrate-binding protein [Pseudomonadota bacterium]